MSWSDIEATLPNGHTMENLPDGFRVTPFFLNAFFKAYQERIEFVSYSSYRYNDFNDLFLVNEENERANAILPQELKRRLLKFNSIISTVINNFNNKWHNQTTIDYLRAGERQFDILDNESAEEYKNLFTINLYRFYTVEDLVAEIGQETYDFLRVENNTSTREWFFKKTWEALYKILKFIRSSSVSQSGVNATNFFDGSDLKMALLTTDSTVYRFNLYSDDGRRYTEFQEPIEINYDYRQKIQEVITDSIIDMPENNHTHIVNRGSFFSEDEYSARRLQGNIIDSADVIYSVLIWENAGPYKIKTPSNCEIYAINSTSVYSEYRSYKDSNINPDPFWQNETPAYTWESYEPIDKSKIYSFERDQPLGFDNRTRPEDRDVYTPDQESFLAIKERDIDRNSKTDNLTAQFINISGNRSNFTAGENIDDSFIIIDGPYKFVSYDDLFQNHISNFGFEFAVDPYRSSGGLNFFRLESYEEHDLSKYKSVGGRGSDPDEQLYFIIDQNDLEFGIQLEDS